MKTTLLVAGLLAAGSAFAQVPVGESRLPTEAPTPATSRPGGDDCRQRSQAVRDQFQLQEQAIRREMAERGKLASSESERTRLRAEAEQRISSLKNEAANAERQVMAACRG